MDFNSSQPSEAGFKIKGTVILLVLGAVLVVLFHAACFRGYTLFSNDGPLGALAAQCHHVPQAFTGAWNDLNSVGFREGGAPASVTYGLMLLLGPTVFSKFYPPLALFVLGAGALCFFRQLRLAPAACLGGSLAAMLNSGFFSAACWGVGTHAITIGMCFLALAALGDTTSRRRWLRVALAGLAVGMAVTEGADIGALFSLYIAAFVMYQAWIQEGPRPQVLARGVSRVAVVAVFAGFLAAQTISALIATNISGIAGTQQDSRTREERWDWATQWSLPKREALGLLIPGLFGYRMDTPKDMALFQGAYEGGVYWGAAGRDPAWYRYFEAVKSDPNTPPPAGFLRFTGGGNYAGVLVVLVGCWAVCQGLRKKDSVFPLGTRRWIWFWLTAAIISLLLAFGRFAPFYQFLYALPYFSTIRNPAKFLHLLNWTLVVLFAYGVHGLWQRYVEVPAKGATGVLETFKAWWRQARGFDRRWRNGCLAALAVCLLGALIYASSREGLVKYLQEVGFDPAMSQQIARFSIGQVAWFLVFFAAAMGLVMLVMSGAWSGRRAKWAGIALGLFLVVDLGRANQPWIVVWNYEQKYATNPVLDFLREKPYEHRVALLPEWINRSARAPQQLDLVDQLYRIEWAQHHFLYYNVQSLDVVQMPRMPEDLAAFEGALMPRSLADVPRLITRRWQLTNTRYLIGPEPGVLDFLNQQLDPEQRRFRIAQRFQILPKPGIANPTKLEELTAVPDTNGPFAVFEFTGALPRAKLYANWQVSTNDATALPQLTSAAFDPGATVLVHAAVPPSPAAATNANANANANVGAGTVQFAAYAPKDIKLNVSASQNAILLLNDRYDPNWKVQVDGKPAELLRCNYLMRGVYLAPGSHEVQFRFQPPMNAFYVSLAALGVGLVLGGLLLLVREPPPGPAASEPARKEPARTATRARG